MAQAKAAVRLGTEGKEDAKRDFREYGDAGDAAAARVARGFDKASQDVESALRRQAAAAQKIAAIMPQTATQMRINDTVGTGSTLNEGSARISAAAFRELYAEQERLTAGAAALRAQIDPAWAAQQRFNAQMRDARSLIAGGAITLDEYCAKLRLEKEVLESTASTHEAGIDRTSRLRYAYQSLGYQIQDIGASLSTVSGPAGLFRIFAQQGGQVFDALNQIAQAGGSASKGTQEVGEASDEAGAGLSEMGEKAIGVAEKVENTGGKFGKFAAFMAGPWGAALMVGMAVLGPLVAKLFESGEASEEAAKAAKEHAAAIDNLIQSMERETRTADQLTRQKYADAWAERQSTIEAERKTQALIAQAKARLALADAQGSDGTGEGGVNFGITAGATQSSLIARLEAQSKDTQDRIDAITLAMNRQQSLMTVSAVEASRDPQKRVQRDYDRAYAAALADREKTGDINAFARAIRAAQDARDAELKKIQESERALRSSAQARKDGDSATTSQVSKILLEAFGGTITSTTGGKHVKGSYHYKGQAVDFVPTGGMGAISKDQIRSLMEGAGLTIKELLGPGDKGHSDHFHVAWSGGKGAIDSENIRERLEREATRKESALNKMINSWVLDQNIGNSSRDALTAAGEAVVDRQKAFRAANDDISAGNVLLNVEWELRGKSRREIETAVELRRYQLELERSGKNLTAEQVDDLVKAKAAQIAFTNVLDDTNAKMEALRDIGASVVDNVLNPNNWTSWKNVGLSAINDVVSALWKMAVINPIQNKINGNSILPTIGNLLGLGKASDAVKGENLLGSAIGNNYTPAGRMLVGENGPEEVVMPRGAKVLTASETRRSMQAQSNSLQVRVIKGDLFDVEVAQISAGVSADTVATAAPLIAVGASNGAQQAVAKRSGRRLA